MRDDSLKNAGVLTRAAAAPPWRRPGTMPKALFRL